MVNGLKNTTLTPLALYLHAMYTYEDKCDIYCNTTRDEEIHNLCTNTRKRETRRIYLFIVQKRNTSATAETLPVPHHDRFCKTRMQTGDIRLQIGHNLTQ